MHGRITKPGKYSYEFNGEMWVLTYIKDSQWKTQEFRFKASVKLWMLRNGIEI